MTSNLRSDVVIKTALAPVVVSDNTAQQTVIIDTKGAQYLEWGILTGVLADSDATFTTLVEDGEDSLMGDNEAVPDTFLQGTEAAAGFQFDDDGEVRRIGLRPRKRYAQLTITPANNTGSAPLAVVALLSGHQQRPITQPDS